MDKKLKQLREAYKLFEDTDTDTLSIPLGDNRELYFSKDEWADDLWQGTYIDKTTGEIFGFLELWADNPNEGDIRGSEVQVSNVKLSSDMRGKGIYAKSLIGLSNWFTVMSDQSDTMSPQAKRAWEKIPGVEQRDGLLVIPYKG